MGTQVAPFFLAIGKTKDLGVNSNQYPQIKRKQTGPAPASKANPAHSSSVLPDTRTSAAASSGLIKLTHASLQWCASLSSLSETSCPGTLAPDAPSAVYPPFPLCPECSLPDLLAFHSWIHSFHCIQQTVVLLSQWTRPCLLTGWPCLASLRGPDICTSLTESLHWMCGAGEEGLAVIRDFSLYKLPLRRASDWSTAGTHVLTCNAGPVWSWGSCDNQSSCHSGRKCSFTTMWPGAIIYYAFRQWEPCQLQHGAAVSAISHHSPSQPFVPRSLRWIITGGQHIFQESLSCYV